MKLFNRNTDVSDMLSTDEADMLDRHPFSKEEDQDNEHPDEYYCGPCGAWIPIAEYRTHTH